MGNSGAGGSNKVIEGASLSGIKIKIAINNDKVQSAWPVIKEE